MECVRETIDAVVCHGAYIARALPAGVCEQGISSLVLQPGPHVM